MIQPSFALGTLSRIWRYPVKSLRGEELPSVAVEEDGLAGDRRRMLLVRTPDHPRSGKAYRGKEDRRLHLMADPSDAQKAVRQSGIEIEERGGGRYFDDAPVSVVASAWLSDLEQRLGFSLDVRRFRPNFFFETAAHIPRELALVGATLEIGSVLLRVISPNVRCVTTTYDVQTGAENPEVLRALAHHRDAVMGVYCTVLRAGTADVGATARVDLLTPVPA